MKVSVFYWIPFIQLLTCICTQFASSICLENQRTLLLELRNNLEYNIAKSNKLGTWNQSSDCCQWNGVQCNNSTGYVTGLDFCGAAISRIVDDFDSLGSFHSLQSLNLANNSFNSAGIPTGIGKLSGLTCLNLSNAGFSGQIPIEISRLVNLVTLDLSCGSFLSGIPSLKLKNPSLGDIIRNLTNLRGLYLNCVQISAIGSEWCNALSISVPNLQFLSLISCNLSGGIDSSLEKLPSLSEIRLDQNNLANVVPDFIADFRNLTLLTLSNCYLNGTFPQKVLQLPTLRTLDLSYNSFLHGVLPEFPVGASLQRLVLSYTIFSGQLPKSVGNLLQLQGIELQNCSFSGPIPYSLGKVNQLEYVDLSHNNFSGPIPSISSAKKIICLLLSNNILTGTLASTNWSSFLNLVDLDLSNNSLQGNIPMEMFSLPSLQSLQLFQNRFTGILREMPEIPSLVLDTLDLSNNNLTGSIPNSLFGLKALRILRLSCNNFIGALNLNVIQQLKNLSTLELSFNSLSIEVNDRMDTNSSFPQLSTLKLAACYLSVIPDFLKNQSSLRNLDLSINSIGGIMPKWLWGDGNGSLNYLNLSCNSFTGIEQPLPGRSALNILDIHGNKIQGEVPTVTSPSMIYLDYSNNRFTSISPDIGKFISWAAYLSLSRNSFSHEIPTTLCNATALTVLDLSFNSLKGKIPRCVVGMTSTLKVLNLNRNNLRSTIIDKFPENCSLSTLHFGQNSLQGQIPRSLANCKQLEVLDLGRNHLNDTFPLFLRNLTNLRVLVLRANHFHGSISCPNYNISWPLLQIMDLASNHFDGVLNAKCFSHFKALTTLQPESATSQLRVAVMPLDNVYYQDTVVVSPKGEEINLQKILTLYKGIDISCNAFHGEIPTTIGYLVTLIFLNLSNNVLSGSIPSSIGDLTMLESLDLSHNDLSGMIPTQISKLNFLSLLNLSYNKLTGTIPQGNQLRTLNPTAYIGNPGLCGSPLSKCSPPPSETVSVKERETSNEAGFDWQFILIGAGFGTGLALVTCPLLFWGKGRNWHDRQVNKIVSAICSNDGIDQASVDDEFNQNVGHQMFSFTSLDDEDKMMGSVKDVTRFCLFCSKFDNYGRRVSHDPRCSCHTSRDIKSITSPSSSLSE